MTPVLQSISKVSVQHLSKPDLIPCVDEHTICIPLELHRQFPITLAKPNFSMHYSQVHNLLRWNVMSTSALDSKTKPHLLSLFCSRRHFSSIYFYVSFEIWLFILIFILKLCLKKQTNINMTLWLKFKNDWKRVPNGKRLNFIMRI